MNWTDILKRPYPNHTLPPSIDPATGKTRARIKGSGKYGSFRFDELDKIFPMVVQAEVMAHYHKLGDKVSQKLKKEGRSNELSAELNKLKDKMRNNLYITTYGSDKGFFGGGGIPKGGYDPNSPEEMEKMRKRIQYVGRMGFMDYSPEKKVEPKPEVERPKPLTTQDLKTVQEEEEEEATPEQPIPSATRNKPKGKEWRKRLRNIKPHRGRRR
jgi:hypothetical protein